MDKNWKIETLAVQAGYEPGNGDPRIVPIVQSTTYKYDDVQSVADLFDLKREGFFYTRLANPTVDVFEKKIAAMEKGVAAVAVSSGQTANAFALMNIARAGDHVLALSSLYGGTVSLFTNTLKKAGIEITFVTPDAGYDEVISAIRPNTKVVLIQRSRGYAWRASLLPKDMEPVITAVHKVRPDIFVMVDNCYGMFTTDNEPSHFGADVCVGSLGI